MPLLEVGMKIFIDASVASMRVEAMDKVVLSSVIEEVQDTNTLLIQLPTHQGSYYQFSSFRPVSIRFPTKTSFFVFDAKFQGTVKRGSLTLARMQKVSGFEERQLRDCFRLPCLIPVQIKQYWASETSEPVKSGYRFFGNTAEPGSYEGAASGHLLDLSDGGALLASGIKIERGDKLTLDFMINFEAAIECVVLRSLSSPNQNYEKCYGVCFKNINSRTKERIYQYLVGEQLKKKNR
jgi:hypothetical protein